MILNGSLAMKPCLNTLSSRHVAHAVPPVLNISARESQDAVLLSPPRGWLSTNLSGASAALFSSIRDHRHHATHPQVVPKHTPNPNRLIPKAFIRDIFLTIKSFRYPPMTKRPRWWWRTLACIPYLMPLHESWMYAETAYHLHHFLEEFEILTYPFLHSLGRLPGWFLMAYFFCAYLGVVRQKVWPHFFRFHVVLGMLLEIGLQIVGVVSKWFPLGLYWGKVGMHFWTFFAFAHMFTVIDCISCALQGKYADLPFVSDAAYIQMPYD